jgi:hypothetical protein
MKLDDARFPQLDQFAAHPFSRKTQQFSDFLLRKVYRWLLCVAVCHSMPFMKEKKEASQTGRNIEKDHPFVPCVKLSKSKAEVEDNVHPQFRATCHDIVELTAIQAQRTGRFARHGGELAAAPIEYRNNAQNIAASIYVGWVTRAAPGVHHGEGRTGKNDDHTVASVALAKDDVALLPTPRDCALTKPAYFRLGELRQQGMCAK